MSQPYVGEIRMFAGNFAPQGWMLCEGQVLAISDYETLFNLIGTTYGGDGQNTFALPDLRSRFPMHQGSGAVLAAAAGEESVTLTNQQIPVHAHPVLASATATSTSPANTFPAVSALTQYAVPSGGSSSDELLPTAIGPTGGSQPHDNRSPYLGMNFIISLFGIFPSQ